MEFFCESRQSGIHLRRPLFTAKSVKIPLLSVVVDFTQILLHFYSILIANLLNSLNLIKCKIFEIRKLYIFTSFHPFRLLMISFICTRVEFLSPFANPFPTSTEKAFWQQNGEVAGCRQKNNRIYFVLLPIFRNFAPLFIKRTI